MTTTHYNFPRQARLLSRSQYETVFNHANCRSSDHSLTVLARQNGSLQARLGLAIGKRSGKTAVARNRIKRLVRESFRLHQMELQGLDIVVLGRDTTQQTSNPELRESLHKHWQRVAHKCAKC